MARYVTRNDAVSEMLRMLRVRLRHLVFAYYNQHPDNVLQHYGAAQALRDVLHIYCVNPAAQDMEMNRLCACMDEIGGKLSGGN